MADTDALAQLMKAIPSWSKDLKHLSPHSRGIQQWSDSDWEHLWAWQEQEYLHPEDIKNRSAGQSALSEDIGRLGFQDLAETGDHYELEQVLRKICEQLVAIFGPESVQRFVHSAPSGHGDPFFTDIPTQLQPTNLQGEKETCGCPHYCAVSLATSLEHDGQPVAAIGHADPKSVPPSLHHSPLDVTAPEEVIATANVSEMERFRKLSENLGKKVQNFAEKCSTPCVLLYVEQNRQQWHRVCHVPTGQTLPNLNEIVTTHLNFDPSSPKSVGQAPCSGLAYGHLSSTDCVG
ncbi:hypothetical protein VFPPC_11971 [Pochonia chlamydosporia 170]|uniref:Uncharacterized protein n=1 Tax=Pochonia chlamydosporia 170 TaxID=1380566 RepID=A0A179F1C0_METCM|nr:hypothetical protein VFPPC_11971 [Pochonia chlamydosporia 170]OAQ59050.1 hypothetical protein VFPPC_11971 [Pochonia chlamydosporia 170]